MSFFVSDAWAQAAPAQGGGDLVGFLLPLVIFVVVFYFLLIRPQQKKAKEHRAMVESLKSGDEIITNGGLLGRITAVGDNFVTVEIAPGTEVKVQKHMVGMVTPKGTVKGA